MKQLILPILLILSVVSCKDPGSGSHLIQDKAYRETVHSHFLARKSLAAGRDSVLFSVFEQDLSVEEKEGLEFLYAFMPLSDLAMHDGVYYLKQVRTALEARSFFSWGASVPEDVFLHFVLPYRVNNEYTDTARQVFFRELKDRIAGMPMAEAALEVNHWCHEKVIYKSTDERTSGPLTTVRTAFGRCGEESTFTVSAMRSVGIPARQVYTPRWAHTDDNHAWVEVWIDGNWHFLGACEPEPALDLAWFAEPVKRAMMTHTFVFGKYNGSEEVVETRECYARLNLLRNYTRVKSLPVKVTGPEGTPVRDARVEFGLYNYAEFYPIATQYTAENGICAVTTGYGDLMLHISHQGISASALVRADEQDTVHVRLGDASVFFPEGIYTLHPPAKQAIPPSDSLLAAQNNIRLLQEDSIRAIYIATFIDSLTGAQLAADHNLNAAELWKYLSLSRGNWPEISSFVRGLKPEDRETGMALLGNISEKDLHDIQASTLTDHLEALKTYQPVQAIPDDDYRRYILSPRIGKEFVTGWRSYIQQVFPAVMAAEFRADPVKIREWIAANILPDTINNYYGVPLSPEGMLQLGRADEYSRNLLFVAISRSFGIPARLEPATRRPQYYKAGEWLDVFFAAQSVKGSVPRGSVTFRNLSADKDFVPRYYVHYTIARYDRGRFVTLDYEYDASLLRFPATVTVDTGYYRLITGNRQSGGEVVAGISYFRVTEGETQVVDISLAAATEKSGILGKANLSATFKTLEDGEVIKLGSLTGTKGMVVALIDPSKEPTKHLMEDIRAVKTALDQWGGRVLFLVASDKMTRAFSPSVYRDLPDAALFGHDAGGEVAAAVSTVCSIDGIPQWPVVAVINTRGEISWHSEGYRIGLGDQLLKQLKEADK